MATMGLKMEFLWWFFVCKCQKTMHEPISTVRQTVHYSIWGMDDFYHIAV